MFTLLQQMNNRITRIEEKVDRLYPKVEKFTNSSNITLALDCLPEDVTLPVASIEELNCLNEKLKKDKEYSTILVKK